jgi:hypothetical protein
MQEYHRGTMGKRVVQRYRSVQWSTVTGVLQLYRGTIAAHAYGSNTGG